MIMSLQQNHNVDELKSFNAKKIIFIINVVMIIYLISKSRLKAQKKLVFLS